MKTLLNLFVAMLALVLCASAQAQQQTIAFWDFNGSDFDDGLLGEDEDPQIIHAPSIGSGVLYQQRADTDGNGKGGNAYTSALLGINVADGRAIAWDDFSKSGDNDAEFFAVVATTGFENIQISFDYRGNDDDADGDDVNDGDGFIGFDAKYSLSDLIDVVVDDVDLAQSIKDFDGESIDLLVNVVLDNDSTAYNRITLNAPAGASDQSVFAFRLDDFSENDSVRFDNVLISGTAIAAIPEPSTLAWVCMSGIAMVSRRRRAS